MRTWMWWVLGLGVVGGLGALGVWYYNTQITADSTVDRMAAIELVTSRALSLPRGSARAQAQAWLDRVVPDAGAGHRTFLSVSEARAYHAVLAAISAQQTQRGGVAGYFG